jgi:hypothetical protein
MMPPVLVRHLQKPERIGDAGMSAHHVDMAEMRHAQLNRPAAVVMDRYVSNKWNAPFSEATRGQLQLISVPVKGDY